MYACCNIIVVLCVVWIPISGDKVKPSDIPELSCQGCKFFPDPATDSAFKEATDFSLIVSQNNTNALIGARDYLFKISPVGNLVHALKMNSTAEDFKRCTRINKPEDCFVVIDFIIQKDDGSIVACGEVSSKIHNCFEVDGSNAVVTRMELSCPIYLGKSVKSVYTDGNVFAAYLNDVGRLTKIRLDCSAEKLERLFRRETLPKFLSMYENKGYIYYFFTEFSEDEFTKHKVIYSFVARVCKYDQGGGELTGYKPYLNLYAKARLLCIKPGKSSKDSVADYNIMQQTSVVETAGDVFIYGVFKSSDSSVDASVVCRYAISDIDKVFRTSGYREYQKHDKPYKLKISESMLTNDPRRFKCLPSLDTRKLNKKAVATAFASSVADDPVQQQSGMPVLELEHTTISYIFSKPVTTSLGNDTYHVLYLFDSNVMYTVAVPATQIRETRVLSRKKIAKDPVDIRDVNGVKSTLFVATKRMVIMIPEEECHLYKTCRECVAARNPYCSWYNDSCVKYDPSQRSAYKQELQQGDYSKVCANESASCKISKISDTFIPGKKVVLSCLARGVPAVQLLWKKGGKTLRGQNGTQLVITNYTLASAGNYFCHAENTFSSGSCSYVVPGSAPRINCGVNKNEKDKSWWLTCNITGFPQPTVALDQSGNLSYSAFVRNVRIIEGETYQYLASNDFGIDCGKIYRMLLKTVEFKIIGLWKDDYADVKSTAYAELKATLESQIKTLYKNREVDITRVSFRKGSVIASVTVSGVISSFFDDGLTRPIDDAVKKGKIGSLTVEENTEEPDPTADHQSTGEPLTTVSSRPRIITSSRPSRAPSPSGQPPSTPGPIASPGDRSSSGVKVWVVVLIVILLIILFFFVGYFCRARNLLSELQKPVCRKDSSSSDDKEMQGMSRGQKARESRQKLLRNHDVDGKKERSPKNADGSTNDGPKRASKVSLEIKTNDCEESYPKPDQSNC